MACGRRLSKDLWYFNAQRPVACQQQKSLPAEDPLHCSSLRAFGALPATRVLSGTRIGGQTPNFPGERFWLFQPRLPPSISSDPPWAPLVDPTPQPTCSFPRLDDKELQLRQRIPHILTFMGPRFTAHLDLRPSVQKDLLQRAQPLDKLFVRWYLRFWHDPLHRGGHQAGDGTREAHDLFYLGVQGGFCQRRGRWGGCGGRERWVSSMHRPAAGSSFLSSSDFVSVSNMHQLAAGNPSIPSFGFS